MTSISFHPLPQERVWGGRAIEHAFGRTLPPEALIGESWEIVDRPEFQSVVHGGDYEGQTLRQLIETNPADIMGPRWPANQRFPILVKWLDCRERLSLQVHPPASVARHLGGEPKTENWYVAGTEPGSAVLAGLKPGISAEEFERAISTGTAERCVQRLPTRVGDSLLVRSGIMHAIDAGNLILEIQQNSDTTYRAFDWGRVGLDCKPRALHVRESIECLKANTANPPSLVRRADKATVLAECAEFRITEHQLDPRDTLSFVAGGQPRILSVVSGTLFSDSGALHAGDNTLLPFAAEAKWTPVDGATILVTDNFTGPVT